MLAEGPVCPFLTLAFLREARKLNLVHIFGLYSAMAWQVAELANLAQTPLVITPFTHRETQNLQMLWKRRALNSAAHVITMTNQERAYLTRQYGISDRRISVISPGIEPANYPRLDKSTCRNQLKIPQSAFVVMFLGRKEKNKKISTLLASWEELQRRGYTSVYLLLVGPDTPYAEKSLMKHVSSKRFLNLGSVDEATKITALNACDCLVLPSRSESFGIVFLEAWVVGKPVIAARSEATAELISPDQNGELFEVGAVNELVDKLEFLISNPIQGIAMGAKGRSKVLANFTVQVMSAKIARLYDSIMEGR
jgi:glycosyltransferase involved in cell wall biosynthesis